jgi:hypothetical protein
MRPLINPMDRPHWSSLNNGQRLYAMRQHNIARNRRGLSPIAYPAAASSSSSSSSASSSSTSNVGSPPDIQDFVEEFFDSPSRSQPASVSAFIEGLSYEEEQEADLQAAYELILQEHPELADIVDSPTMVLPGAAAMETQHANKRARTESPAAASQEAGPSGGGGGGVSGGTGGGYVVPRPILSEGTYFRTFKKQHTFLTYGIAGVRLKTLKPPVILPPQAAESVYYITTSLAEIPVHRPLLYLTPGEFNNLDVGARCHEVRVKVTQRNVRVAFETAASTTSLATLNQNKNGVSAVGLNKLPWIIRSSYTTGTDPMVPTAVKVPLNEPSAEQFYGVAFDGTPNNAVPNSLLGHPLALRNYATVCIRTQESVLGNGPDTGWPDLQTHIKKYDAADYVGVTIEDYSYKPLEGWLKRPTRWNYVGAGVPNESMRTRGHVQGTTAWNTGVNGSATYAVAEPLLAPPNIDNLGINFAIEKSDFIMSKTDGGLPRLQPSLHVGVMPVPSLTTSANLTTPAEFTDVQAYFDVEAEMVVRWDKRSEYSGEGTNRFPEQYYPSDIVPSGQAAPINHTIRLGAFTNTPTYYMP